ncbi:MAG: von Willebrand factor type domain protein [Chlorobi bacterium]|nr:von Willebrand factor type domain protein [Chlorobiota bacterium]
MGTIQRHTAIRRILLVALLALVPGVIAAQSISIFNIDPSGFPDIRSEVIFLDINGRPIRSVTPADCFLTENGNPVDAFSITCPPEPPSGEMSVVLVTDRSGSMSQLTRSGSSRIDLARRGELAFIQSVQFIGLTSVAVTAFDAVPIIISDFSTSAAHLADAINNMTVGGATEYTPAFVDPLAGGIALLRGTSPATKRVLIFLTDGQPNHPPDVQRIISEAQAANVTIYTITMGTPLTIALQDIATATGGEFYEDVENPDQLKALYTKLAFKSQGIEPCHMSWRSTMGCGPNSLYRSLELTCNPISRKGNGFYYAPPQSIIRLDASPAFVWFGPVGPPETADKDLLITATGSDISIDNVGPLGPFSITDWGGTAPPFILRKGTSRTLKIHFAPADSNIYGASLFLSAYPCPIQPVTLSGGVRGSRSPAALKLVSPIGGEIFTSCDSVMIRWKGVAPTDHVTIEYSTANDGGWKVIADSATGLLYPWMPPAPGTTYRIRISTSAGRRDTIVNFAGGGNGLDNVPATAALLSTPSSVVALGDLVYLAEEGGNRVRKIDLSVGIVSTVAGTSQAGLGGDGNQATSARLFNPTGIALDGNRLYIADQTNQRIRKVDLGTGVITTVAGSGVVGFSGDGGPATAATLYDPWHLAVGGSALYISERGNDRVRRIDLITGVITTIAGGGASPGGDGDPATSARLTDPAGLAIDGDSLFIAESGAHRVRRVNLHTGIITTVAGDGTRGFSGDGGRADTTHIDTPLGVAISGGSIVISDAGNYRIRSVNRSSGIITTIAGNGLAGASGDDGPPLDARFNRPGGLAADGDKIFVADMLNNRVRLIRLGTPGRVDSSHSAFTVSVARIAAGVAGKEVGFAPTSLGGATDSLIAGLLCNRGDIPLFPDSIELAGTDPADFQVVSGMTSTELAPGECRTVEIRFRPEALGARSAIAILHGRCAGADTILLSGTGLPACGQSIVSGIDFGDVVTESSRDTIIVKSICNRGAGALAGTITVAPAGGPFSLVTGGGPFSLAPGECRDITLRFFPTETGRTSGKIDYGIPEICGPIATLLIGRGIVLQEISVSNPIILPSILCPSESADTAIIITNLGDAPLTVNGVEFSLNDEGFSLSPPLPSPSSPKVLRHGESDTIRVRLMPAGTGPKKATVQIFSNSHESPTEVQLYGRRDTIDVRVNPPVMTMDGGLSAGSYPLDMAGTIDNRGSIAVTISGATITGADASRFDIPPGQFPMLILPGAGHNVHVRALGPVAGAGFRATLRLPLAPSCPAGEIAVPLLETGSEPALLATGPTFADLLCADDSVAHGTLRLSNPGNHDLHISGFRFEGADSAMFRFDQRPITVRGDTTIAIDFVPARRGTFTARLIISSDAPSGDSVILLTGALGRIGFAASPRAIDLGVVVAGVTADSAFTALNTGTAPATLLTSATGDITVRPSVAIDTAERAKIGFAFLGSAPGTHRDTIILRDNRCGIADTVIVSATVVARVRTIAALPTDSARPGTRVPIPIRLSIPDRAAFNASGAHAFRTTIAFNGLVLLPDSPAVRGTITSMSFDVRTGAQRVTIDGEYGGSDTVAIILCEVIQSDSTPLTFVSFAWDRPGVMADTVNGSFTTIGRCFDAQAHLVARPRILRVRPMPVGSGATIEIQLDDPQMLTATLADTRGGTVREIASGYFPAGTLVLPLSVEGVPSGTYTLLVRTEFGEASRRIVVVR